MAKSIKFRSLTDKPLLALDWVAFALLAVVCLLSFGQGGDIRHTAGSSFTFLEGHILDFYDYNVQHLGLNNYLPSSYILFAIWNIPLKLFGIVKIPSMNPPIAVDLWYRLLPTLFYMASSYLMFKIAVEVGMGEKKAKMCAYAFLTMPIGFYSQFMFGQYDSFTVFFMLLGLLFYFRKDWLKFSIFFGIALTCKYFPFFIFVPLLLLGQKNIWKIIKYGVVAMLPLALEILVFMPSPAFRQGVFEFGATSYIFQIALNGPSFSISLFVILWMILVAAAYFQETDNDADVVKWSFFYGNITAFLLFGLSMWHPQWLLFAVPFWVFGTFISKKFEIFMILEVIMMILYIMFVTVVWTNDLDQGLFWSGIFRDVLDGRIGSFLSFWDMIPLHSRSPIYSVLSGVLLVTAIFKHPKFCSEDIAESVDRHWGWVRFRFIGGVSVFLVPALLCFIVALRSPQVVFDAGVKPAGMTDVIVPGQDVEQIFMTNGTSISCVQVHVCTYGRNNDSNLTMTLMDSETREILTSVTLPAKKFDDNTYVRMFVDPVYTEPYEKYILVFSSADATENSAVSIFYTTLYSDDTFGYANIDGIKQAYDLSVKVFGEK